MTATSMRWSVRIFAAAIVLGTAAVAYSIDVDFTSDPLWTAFGNTTDGNNYGYSGGTNHAGGAMGEAGGMFARNGSESYFADTNLDDLNGADPRDLDLDDAMSASGLFTAFGQNNTDQAWAIGHLSEDTANGSFLGLMFFESSDTAVRVRAGLRGGTSTDGNDITVPNGQYNFEYSYDPTIGFGRISVRVFNGGFDQTSIGNLSEADRDGGQSFDGFGLTIPAGVAPGNDPARTVQTFIDNVSYTGFSGAPPAHPGDFDGDGDVDGADFVAWQTNFPKSNGATLAEGDADGDGDVDGADFVVWQTNFPFTPGSGASPVPEPGSIVFSLMAGLSLIGIARARQRSRSGNR